MRFGVIRLVHPLDAPCQLLDELHRRAMGSGELARHHLFEGIGGPNAFREIQTRFERTGIERELDAVAACVRRDVVWLVDRVLEVPRAESISASSRTAGSNSPPA